MPTYSLIESKLRRFIFLGNEYPIFIAPILRKPFWESNEDIYGVQIIGKTVKKNRTDEINSIVPIILKINEESKLHDDKYLIFALAVCAKFNLKQCEQMVIDAYAAVPLICTDGLKLLMFVKFCNMASSILYDQGYVDNKFSGFGRGFKKVLKMWYLTRDPFETAKQIIRYKSYRGITHKDIIKKLHIGSDDPIRQIYIVHTCYGMKKVEKIFKSKLLVETDENASQNSTRIQLELIYNYLQQVNKLSTMDENSLQADITLNMRGKEIEVIPQKMLKNSKILASLILHIPLDTLLDNTYYFAKRRLFFNFLSFEGCWSFILRFSETTLLQNSKIHPIAPYIEYLRYSKTSRVIAEIKKKNEIKNKMHPIIPDLPFSFDEIVQEMDYSTFVFPFRMNINDMKLPKLADPLMYFLSEDLMTKTLNKLKPTEGRILIAYDGRQYMNEINCKYMHVKFLNVSEAIVLIILSLIYPNQSTYYEPTLCNLINQAGKYFKRNYINHEQPLTVNNLRCMLFNNTIDDKIDCVQQQNIRNVNPMSTINWAMKYKIEYDVFVFLGITKMNLKNIKNIKKKYEKLLKRRAKIIICCLNGIHAEMKNIGNGDMLFIAGFDKNISNIIKSFINDEF